MNKRLIGLFAILGILLSVTGCSLTTRTVKILNGANKYCIGTLSVINAFSIHQASSVVNSEATDDSIYVEYENGGSLFLQYSKVTKYGQTFTIRYSSDNSLSAEEIINILCLIVIDEVPETTQELIEEFAETGNAIEFRLDQSDFRLEREDTVFFLESAQYTR